MSTKVITYHHYLEKSYNQIFRMKRWNWNLTSSEEFQGLTWFYKLLSHQVLQLDLRSECLFPSILMLLHSDPFRGSIDPNARKVCSGAPKDIPSQKLEGHLAQIMNIEQGEIKLLNGWHTQRLHLYSKIDRSTRSKIW